jgi:23S rRNA (cytosine1962-C5)-methyltransferase
MTVLFEDDDIIAVDKAYGFNSHTNDSKVEHSEFIQDGLIEIFEKQRNQKLHIIHRLDQTTTGVIVFGKSQESAKKYADYFFNRQVKKTYLFITANKSKSASFLIDEAIVHKGRELEAQTQLTFLKRTARYELWQANPFTGRNHQIRLHARAAGISILGDPTYGGSEFHFLCLHNHRIEFPNGLVITSEPPPYFRELSYLEDKVLAQALFQIDRRQRLFSRRNDQQMFRLVDSKSGGGDLEFNLDHFGPRLILNSNKELNEPSTRRYLKLSQALEKPILVRTPSRLISLPNETAGSLPPTWLAREDSRLYEFSSESTAAHSFPLGHRLPRAWVYENARGKLVLSLFAGFGSFALAAAKGGASEVTVVEFNKAALNAGKACLNLNQIGDGACKFLLRDSLVFIKQALAKKLKFDLIICETPTFFRGEKKVFKLEEDLENLLADCLHCLTPTGALLISASSERFTISRMRQSIEKLLKQDPNSKREIQFLEPSFDFSLPNEGASLKTFLVAPLTV